MILIRVFSRLGAFWAALMGALIAAVTGAIITAIGFLFRLIFSHFRVETSFEEGQQMVWRLRSYLNKTQGHRRFPAYMVSITGSEERQKGKWVKIQPHLKDCYLFYKGRLVYIHRIEREKRANQGLPTNIYGDSEPQGPQFTYRVTVFFGDKEILEDFFTEVLQVTQSKEQREVSIFVSKRDSWELAASRPMRSVDSLFLGRGVKEQVLKAVEDFLSSKEWYRRAGVPWRMGILATGIKGSGKTSLVQMIAGQYDLDIYIFRLGDPAMNDVRFESLCSSTPKRSIWVIEELDCVFNGRKNVVGAVPVVDEEIWDEECAPVTIPSSGQKAGNGLTASGFLTALDGITAPEGRIVFITSNNKELLDEAMIRKGRIDLEVEFGYADAYQIQSIFEHFYPTEPREKIQDCAEKMATQTLTMADVQSYLIAFRADFDSAYLHAENVRGVIGVVTSGKMPGDEAPAEMAEPSMGVKVQLALDLGD